MELILNDFSVIGQFTTYDEFADYVIKTVSPVLDCVIERKIIFLKRQSFYSSKITEKLTLNDILMHTGDPVIYKIRYYITQLAYQRPYWDEEPMSKNDVCYQYPAKGNEPNCFTEVIERKGAVFSFPADKYTKKVLECYRGEEKIFVQNITEKKSFLYTYLAYDKRNIRYVLERYPYTKKVILATVGEKCYAEEALLDNGLTTDDLLNIVQTIPRMMEAMDQGEKNDYWDKLRDGIFEYRVHVSSGRIFRLFFFQEDGIVFLNGFIKKTQATPSAEISKAIKIKNSLA